MAINTIRDLLEVIERRLPEITLKTAKARKKKKQEMALDIWLHADISEMEALMSVIINTKRKDEEMEALSKEIGAPGIFESIKRKIREKQELHQCSDYRELGRNVLKSIFEKASSEMEKAKREDIEVLLAIIIQQIDESKYLPIST